MSCLNKKKPPRGLEVLVQNRELEVISLLYYYYKTKISKTIIYNRKIYTYLQYCKIYTYYCWNTLKILYVL